MRKLITVWLGLILIYSVAFSAIFYIDPINGSDAGNGSAASPWQSIQKTLDLPEARAKAAAGGEITFILKGGNYGVFNLTSAAGRPKAAAAGTWTTYQAAPGEEPVFEGMRFVFDELTPLCMKFDGIHVRTPKGNAKAAKAALDGFSSGPIHLDYVSNVEYLNGKFIGPGQSPDSPDGAYVMHSRNLRFENNEVRDVDRGLLFAYCSDGVVLGNHIHRLGGTGVKYAMGNSNFLIERNHIHNSMTGGGIHSSAISIRSGDVIIRGNIMHDGFASSGMMTYNEDNGTYFSFKNVTIENNLMYDIANTYVMRLYNLVSNIVIRNNTFIGKTYVGKEHVGTMCLSTAIAFHSGTASALSVYNNILIGACFLPAAAKVGHNIMWSYKPDDWTCVGPGGSKVLTCISASKPYNYVDALFTGTPNYNPLHHQIIDYGPVPGSEAINFGDASKQPVTSLGTLDANGFIQQNGPVRGANHHSAGAYEFGTGNISILDKNQLPGVSSGMVHNPLRLNETRILGNYEVVDMHGSRIHPARINGAGVYMVRVDEIWRKIVIVK